MSEDVIFNEQNFPYIELFPIKDVKIMTIIVLYNLHYAIS